MAHRSPESNALMKRTLAGVNVTVTLSTIVLPPLLKRRKHRAGFDTYEWRGIEAWTRKDSGPS